MYNSSEKRKTSAGHDLAYKMWATKGSRFQADERNKKLSRISTLTISFISVEVIALNLFSIANLTPVFVDVDFLSLFTVIGSIFILLFSVLENAKSYKSKALTHHACALEIGKVYTKLKRVLASNENKDFNDDEVLESTEAEYDKILEKYENHQNVDFQKFLLDRHRDFHLGWKERWGKRINIYFRTWFVYHFFILIGPMLMLIYSLQ